MGKQTLYSRSSRTRPKGEAAAPVGETVPPAAPESPTPAGAAPPLSRWRRWYLRGRSPAAWLGIGVLLAALAFSLQQQFRPGPRQLKQADIDAAVLHTMNTKVLPSPAAKAYETIRPSVVRVRALGHDKKKDPSTSIGSGVVVLESGVILTSLHVVSGAESIEVTFFDGLESEAQIVSAQPQNDLAVLQAKTLPDDLMPATLRSTKDLVPGDLVVATGFPFGLGPSASAGIVSGLKREFHSPDAKVNLTNLIQFDAAANPGNSGGPLVTADGEVVGIVTAILNPSEQRVFIGIGFAVPIENAASSLGLTPF